MPRKGLLRITIDQIKALSTAQSFERGRDYHRRGAIVNPMIHGSTLRAECEGSRYENYLVTVRLSSKGVQEAECTCPYDWGGYCKHIVALLLKYHHDPEDFTQVEDITGSLRGKSQEELIALIEAMVERYPDLISFLERKGRSPGRATRIDEEAYRRQVEGAFGRDFVDWDEIGEVLDELEEIRTNAEGFAERGDYADAMTVLTALVKGCVARYGQTHDEGQIAEFVGECIERLGELVPRAEIQASKRQGWLKEMFELRLADGYGLTEGLMDVLLKIARPEDRPVLERLAKERLANLKPKDYQRGGIVHFLLDLYELDGRDKDYLALAYEEGEEAAYADKLIRLGRVEEALAFIREANLSAMDYLQLVESLIQVREPEKALALGEEGMKRGTGWKDHLAERLAALYGKRGDFEAALKAYLARFQEREDLDIYQKIAKVAKRLGRWEQVREDLLMALRKKKTFHMLTEIHLLDGELDEAIESVKHLTYPSEALMARVASASEKPRPQAAIALYKKLAEACIQETNRRGYQRAVPYLKKVKVLYKALGEEQQWQDYLAFLRQEHAKKRAFLEEIRKL